MPVPVLVTSGKGGVGKSTVSANLAVALLEKGLKVSLLDADLMDPVMHILFRANREELRERGKALLPLRVRTPFGELEFMGLGAFVPRGVGVALNYEKTADFMMTLLRFVRWTGDYLVIDTPPGSIDVNVKLLKELRGRAKAVLVGEPHPFALEDNLRMLDLLRLYDVDVRAVVLNKVGLFVKEVEDYAKGEYSKLGVRVVEVPWDRELQLGFKPELPAFKELAEAVVG
jgi:ATP-binding protein involved in chromosome partitioning